MTLHQNDFKKATPTSTVGRGKTVVLDSIPSTNKSSKDGIALYLGDSLNYYEEWDT